MKRSISLILINFLFIFSSFSIDVIKYKDLSGINLRNMIENLINIEAQFYEEGSLELHTLLRKFKEKTRTKKNYLFYKRNKVKLLFTYLQKAQVHPWGKFSIELNKLLNYLEGQQKIKIHFYGFETKIEILGMETDIKNNSVKRYYQDFFYNIRAYLRHKMSKQNQDNLFMLIPIYWHFALITQYHDDVSFYYTFLQKQIIHTPKVFLEILDKFDFMLKNKSPHLALIWAKHKDSFLIFQGEKIFRKLYTYSKGDSNIKNQQLLYFIQILKNSSNLPMQNFIEIINIAISHFGDEKINRYYNQLKNVELFFKAEYFLSDLIYNNSLSNTEDLFSIFLNFFYKKIEKKVLNLESKLMNLEDSFLLKEIGWKIEEMNFKKTWSIVRE